MTSLKQFIRAVRSAKTLNDERGVIQKESAAIRASFRDDGLGHNSRRNNVSKLLYLFTLGERTHFGQIECVKLLASPRFADKRLGYLGTMLLLDENQEVLTLVTNSLKNDLNHNNQYIVGLALCTLGNIASAEMARDLYDEVDQLLASQNGYLRRKAALCAIRIIRKVPELQDHYIEKVKPLLQDRNHGVLLCGVTLVIEMCLNMPEAIEQFRPFTSTLTKHLKALTSSGYAPEHDVTGITDPFLQVKILKLLRILGKGDVQVSEQINDMLAQVATNTDSTKNVGNAVLYETVLTILDIEADSSLRVLGVNILGKFLSNKDNNIRYVALNTLMKVVTIEPNAVQRHRNTILDCLRDPDISIRRRALDLSFTLINKDNVRLLIRELLAFLEIADNEFKPNITTQISIAADKFAPSKRWHIDTILRVLKLAGNYVKEGILASFIRLVATTSDLQTYSVQKLYAALKSDITQEGLTLAAAWVIGEYGDLLLRGGNAVEDEEVVKNVKDVDVIDLLSNILRSAYESQVVTEYILTALTKLTTRMTDAAQIERVRRILNENTRSLDVEIQQRAVEYGNLFGFGNDIRSGVLEKMPPPEARTAEDSLMLDSVSSPRPARKTGKATMQSTAVDLLDLMGGDDATPAAAPAQNNMALLADLLGSAPSGPSQPSSNGLLDLVGGSPAPAPTSAKDDILSLFGNLNVSTPPVSSPSPAAVAAPVNELTVYNKNGLLVTFHIERTAGAVVVHSKFKNVEMGNISGLNLQIAVPKSQTIQFQAPLSTTELGPGGEATQAMRVVGSNGPLRLKLRFIYNAGGSPISDQMNWSEPK
ncbi:Adaptor protein complex AP-1 gamma subunit [Ascobolus immersus RN42]|uniref:AP-1 complex subunit gamma n=1 Tax=Ascobolus immersus RN42 TaxID=1160509 RepID=A0A3N4ITR2_ASCIM|nr:Adaptor protein complex AP-1 gamma subunit [Ascobolus immersus RN42]